jgi:geranylgeranyl transferase type-2 subunit alpha
MKTAVTAACIAAPARLQVLAAGGEAAVAAVGAELALTEKALYRNPKSYATWHHRKWVVGKGLCSLEHELKLVGLLLEADERNFHGWNYRRFVVQVGLCWAGMNWAGLLGVNATHRMLGLLGNQPVLHGPAVPNMPGLLHDHAVCVQLMGTPAARELDYAERKINQNFSNYSAWHSRTALLPALHDGDENALAAALQTAAITLDDTAAAAAEGAAGAAAETAPVTDGSAPPLPAAASSAPVPAPAPAPAGSSAAATAAVPKDALDVEYELVKQAFYTEPEDQSGWFYHRWLLGEGSGEAGDGAGQRGAAAARSVGSGAPWQACGAAQL